MSINAIMAQFAGELALVNPSKTNRFEALAAQVVQHPRSAELLSGEYLMHGDFWQEDGGWCRPYVVTDGILQIPVKGMLLNNFPYSFYDWATGYEFIWEAFKRGCADYAIGAIKGIALVSDSPGGMVAGCFDAVDRMVALKEATGVPVWGFAHESCYSAAYAIVGGVADQLAVSRTGGVGSIGVVTCHLDMSGAAQQAGLKFTYIASDPSKVEGNPYEALSADALARIQARIDELYDIFVATVVRGRGLDEAAIRKELKAYSFTASQALSNGLADSIGSLEDATSAFAECLDDPSDNQGEEAMAGEANLSAVEQAAAIDAAREEGRKIGLAEGATAERTRVAAILDSAEAQDRPALARHLALKSDTSPEAASGLLTVAAKETVVAPAPAAAATPFAAAMDSTKNPDVGAGDAGENAENDGQADILASLTGMALIKA